MELIIAIKAVLRSVLSVFQIRSAQFVPKLTDLPQIVYVRTDIMQMMIILTAYNVKPNVLLVQIQQVIVNYVKIQQNYPLVVVRIAI